MTIHITPEEEFSYVSFESNVSAANYGEIISRVIETFKPGKFVVTIFANKVSLIYTISVIFMPSLTHCLRKPAVFRNLY